MERYRRTNNLAAVTHLALPFQVNQGFDGLIGLELTELTDEIASGTVVGARRAQAAAGACARWRVRLDRREPRVLRDRSRRAIPRASWRWGSRTRRASCARSPRATIHAKATRRHRGRTHLGVGGRDLRRRRQSVRADADDDGRPRDAELGRGACSRLPGTGSAAAEPVLRERVQQRVVGGAHRDEVRPGQADQPSDPGAAREDHRLAGRRQRRREWTRHLAARRPRALGAAFACRT